MERNKLLHEIANVMEKEICELTDDYDLKGHGLDSLIVVSMIAAIDIIYGVRVQASDIDKCETIKDVFNLIKLKQKAS